jgi:hypothetical protein
VSFSRRGIIAAGLAIASVGAIGISSSLNAGAATITTPDTATTATADGTTADGTPADGTTTADTGAAASLPTPPPGLPGGRATSRRSGQAGPQSADRASRKPLTLTPRRGLKGRPDAVTSRPARVGTAATAVGAAGAKAPVPPGTEVSGAEAGGGVRYHYSQAYQKVQSKGMWAYVTVGEPTVAGNEFHSLAELAVRSADRKQTVEVGWIVDPGMFGDAKPHLFVYHWVDGVPKCYNGCGFVQYSSKTSPGAVIPAKTARVFDIQFFGDGWWIGLDNDWIGYFPSSLWGGRFKEASLVQWFGEVAAGPAPPCSDMGNGTPSTDNKAALFDRFGLYGVSPSTATVVVDEPSGDLTRSDYHYPVRLVPAKDTIAKPPGTPAPQPQSVYFGGPGAC